MNACTNAIGLLAVQSPTRRVRLVLTHTKPVPLNWFPVPRSAQDLQCMRHPHEKHTTLADLCSTPLGHSKSTAKRHRARSSSVSHLSNSGAEAGPSVTSPVASYDQGAEECDKDHTTPMELSPIAYDC